MDKVLINKVRGKIIKLHSTNGKESREIIRNEIYLEMKSFMISSIRGILLKKGIHRSNEEIISMSWECFEYCLFHYKHKKKIPIPSHFYKYSFYFVTTTLKKERNKQFNSKEVSLDEIENFNGEHFENLYEDLEELESFRNTLPTNYVPVFDDALMSLAPQNKDKINRSSELSMSNVRYSESKKIFKWIINFLIKR